MDHPAVCILPRLEGVGGPASFRARLVSGLRARGVALAADPSDPACRSVLVIGGTRQLYQLYRARRRGLRVVQRLNGMNWIHRRRFTGVRHFLRSEVNNQILAIIRRRIASHIVYQSHFARNWWQTVYRQVSAPSRVVYNAVDLSYFHPAGPGQPPQDRYRILLVEGHLGGGNEMGLRNALDLTRLLNQRMDRPVELVVVGDVPGSLQSALEREHTGMVQWAGVLPRDAIPEVDRSAHVLFSGDLNAACPNSVIEALGCGLPVVSYATGSLPELLQGEAGLTVPWGSNFWKLEQPDIPVLAAAAEHILNNQEHYRKAARARAEEAFALDNMVEQYLEVLF
jgi:glycosyltransferase involved in cell wall biosynthesis